MDQISPSPESLPATGLSPSRAVLDAVELVVARQNSLDAVCAQAPAVPFASDTVTFVEAFGRQLLQDPAVRKFPELVALGFWARAANLKRMKDAFASSYAREVRLARGTAFHVAPSNVDTIFVYSLLLSMLAGNVNIVRISSRAGEQANLLLKLLGDALAAAEETVSDRIALVRYAHDRAITDAISSLVDLRIVWGGDATVETIRESPLSPRGTELVFPNRYSLAVIDARAWLGER